VFAPGCRIRGIDDSKKLDAATRDKLAAEIRMSAAVWSVAFAEVEEIDAINIYWAGLLAMRRAVEGLSLIPQHLLLDARHLKDLSIPQQSIVKGDSRSLTITAASILAKTARDALMHKLDTEYPGYRAILSASIRPCSSGSGPRPFTAAPSHQFGRSLACRRCHHGRSRVRLLQMIDDSAQSPERAPDRPD
jgi:hypothetical protein